MRRLRPTPDRDCRSARRRGGAAASDERARDRGTLLLAAGELGRPMIEPRSPVRPAEQRRALGGASSPLATSVGTSTFSRTVHCGSRQWSWKTKPMLVLRKSASAAASRPNGSDRPVTVPARAVRAPPSMYSSETLAGARGPDHRRRLPGESVKRGHASTVNGPRGVGYSSWSLFGEHGTAGGRRTAGRRSRSYLEHQVGHASHVKRAHAVARRGSPARTARGSANDGVSASRPRPVFALRPAGRHRSSRSSRETRRGSAGRPARPWPSPRAG